MEELIAELGAAFLCAELGVSGRLENHASYIQAWLKVLKNDKRAIITAASAASKAFRFVMDGHWRKLGSLSPPERFRSIIEE